jgi:hypothetical protein
MKREYENDFLSNINTIRGILNNFNETQQLFAFDVSQLEIEPLVKGKQCILIVNVLNTYTEDMRDTLYNMEIEYNKPNTNNQRIEEMLCRLDDLSNVMYITLEEITLVMEYIDVEQATLKELLKYQEQLKMYWMLIESFYQMRINNSRSVELQYRKK